MINSACSMAGPMLGALLMSIATMKYIMLVDVAGAVIAVLILTTIKIKNIELKSPGRIKILQDKKEGLNAIKANKALISISIPVLISTIVFVPLGTLLPLMVKGYFSGTAWHNGIVQTLFSIGMLISSKVIGITGGMKKQFSMMSLGILLLGVCGLTGGIIPASMFWLFCIIVFIMGGGTGMLFQHSLYLIYPEKHSTGKSRESFISVHKYHELRSSDRYVHCRSDI